MSVFCFFKCKNCLHFKKRKLIINANNNKNYRKRKAYFRQFISILGGCILMLDVGAQLSWTSTALPYLASEISEIPITFTQSVWLASIDSFCTIFGIIVSPFIMDIIGRKYTILVFGLIQIIAWISINLSTNFLSLCISRIIVGIGYGGTFNLFTIYIGEIAEKNIRGMFLSIEKMCVNLGGFILNSFGAFFPYRTTNLIMISIPILALAAFPFMHETPYFYLLKDQDENAARTLMKLYNKPNPEMVMDDIARMKKTIEECRNSKKNAIHELFTDKSSQRAMIIKIIVDFTYSFSGFLVVQTYAQDIFESTGSSIKPAYSVMVISGIQLLFGLMSSYLVDHWGRKPIYLFSGLSAAICLTLVGFFFFCKFFLKIDVSSISWIPLVFLTFFLVVCNMGLSTVPYIYSGELFSVKVKGMAVTISSIFVGLCLFATKFMTPFLNQLVGIYTSFWLFSSVCVIGSLCIFFIAPETKGKNLEEILEILRSVRKN